MEKAIKALAIIVTVVLVLSLTLLALGVITWRLFWVVAILAAIVAYYVIPKLKERAQAL